MDRICESFGCLPTRAVWELQHDPDQMVVQVLEIRAYRNAKQRYDALKDGDDFQAAVAENPLVAVVRDVEHALAAEQIAAKRAAVIAAAEAEDINS